jgi:hypothetical protein
MRHTLIAMATVLLVAACGNSTVVSEGDPVSSPYDGPMSLPIDHGDEAVVTERSGAAGRAMECDGDPYNGGGADYDDGLASVQDTATDALENFVEEEWLSSPLPVEGYRIEREDDGRVLFSYDVDARTKIAFIAADDVRDYNDDEGWGVESWAQCDPAELPSSVTEALGIEVWEDTSGARVPLTKIHSFQGADHCDWQDITFLLFDSDGDTTEYIRDPSGELADYLLTTYDASADLPDGATDTGLRRDGRQLWLVTNRDAAYLVSIDDSDDVERWPASKEPIRCA